MRVTIIGGSGHIGSYLTPRLVRLGHQVTVITRGKRQPYQEAGEWRSVQSVTADRRAEDKAGTFGATVAKLKPEAVIDLICFNAASAQQLSDGVRDTAQHLLSCGTIWVHGPAEAVPTPEHAVRRPIGDYGIQKNEMEQYLLGASRRGGLPATVIHPGHIVGPGWKILNPQGNFNTAVWKTIAAGEELRLPNLGLECVHHVHADDVAQVFELALRQPAAAMSESFHAVSSQAITLRGYATAAYGWFGQTPKLQYVPLAELKQRLPAEDGEQTEEHIIRSPSMSIEKARRVLGYQPRYSSFEACREAAQWLLR